MSVLKTEIPIMDQIHIFSSETFMSKIIKFLLKNTKWWIAEKQNEIGPAITKDKSRTSLK